MITILRRAAINMETSVPVSTPRSMACLVSSQYFYLRMTRKKSQVFFIKIAFHSYRLACHICVDCIPQGLVAFDFQIMCEQQVRAHARVLLLVLVSLQVMNSQHTCKLADFCPSSQITCSKATETCEILSVASRQNSACHHDVLDVIIRKTKFLTWNRGANDPNMFWHIRILESPHVACA